MTTNQKKQKKQTGSGAPRLADIAQHCGVSIATVSRALQGDTRQSAATIERINQVAKEMGYDPARSSAARRLISQRFGQPVLNYAIAVLFMHELFGEGDYHNKLLRGVFDGISYTGFDLYVCDSHRIPEGKLPIAFRSGNIDGILIMGESHHWKIAQNLLDNEPGFGRRPRVGLVEHLEGGSSVYADHYKVGYDAASHLLELGHRHILHFVGETESKDSVHGVRLSAYIDAYRAFDLDPKKHLHRHQWTFGQYNVTSNKQALVEHLRENTEVTAILARHDLQANEIYDALVEAGYKVPEDISLVSSDDTDGILDANKENILTSVRLPLVEIGYEATKLLIRRVLGDETEDRDIVMPVELIVRKSTAPPRKITKTGDR